MGIIDIGVAGASVAPERQSDRVSAYTYVRLASRERTKKWLEFRRIVEAMPRYKAFQKVLPWNKQSGGDARIIRLEHTLKWDLDHALPAIRALDTSLTAAGHTVVLQMPYSRAGVRTSTPALHAIKDPPPSPESQFSPGIHRYQKGPLYVASRLLPDSTNDNEGCLYVEYWSHSRGPEHPHIRKLTEWVEVVTWPDGKQRPRFTRIEEV